MIAQAVIFFGLFEALAQGPEHGKVFSENFMESFGIENLIKESQKMSPVPETLGSKV